MSRDIDVAALARIFADTDHLQERHIAPNRRLGIATFLPQFVRIAIQFVFVYLGSKIFCGRLREPVIRDVILHRRIFHPPIYAYIGIARIPRFRELEICGEIPKLVISLGVIILESDAHNKII